MSKTSSEDKDLTSQGNKEGIADSSKPIEKKPIGKILGYEVSAPADLKNPMLRITILIIGNVLLLIALRVAIASNN